MSEKEKNPTWKPIDMPASVKTTITIKSAGPMATGKNKWGDWNLWLVEVKDQTVTEKDTGKEIKNFSGDAVTFPSKTLHDKFMEATDNGKNVDVVLEVTKFLKESKKGPYREFEVKVLDGGHTPSGKVSYSSHKFMEDFKLYAEDRIVAETEEDFIMLGEQEPYFFGKDELKELWKTYTHLKNGQK